MKGRNYCNILLVSLFLALSGGVGAAKLLAADVCKNNGNNTKRVCVSWMDGADPILGTDFTVDYDCPACEDAPAIVLTEGSLTWEVWSEVISGGATANIGSLTTTDADNYEVKLANGSGAGAADVVSLVLGPDGDHHSSLASGSHISGDITGSGAYAIRVQQDSNGDGGVLDVTVDGDVNSFVHAWTIPSGASFTVGGIMTDSVSIGEIEPPGGDIAGTLDIESWEPASDAMTIDAYGPVASTGRIRIGSVTLGVGNTSEIRFNDVPDLETGETLFDFAGDADFR